MSVFAFFIFASLSAKAALDKSAHVISVEYSSAPQKEKGIMCINSLHCSRHKEEPHNVAHHRYPESISSTVDIIPRISKGKLKDIEVVIKKADGSIERNYIWGKWIEVRDSGHEPLEFEHKANNASVKLHHDRIISFLRGGKDGI